jgi:L-asparagine transporter-like permease
MEIVILLVIILGIILLGRYIIIENFRFKNHKKLIENIKKHDERINKEINSISPLFNGMTGAEVREMMNKEFNKKHSIK